MVAGLEPMGLLCEQERDGSVATAR